MNHRTAASPKSEVVTAKQLRRWWRHSLKYGRHARIFAQCRHYRRQLLDCSIDSRLSVTGQTMAIEIQPPMIDRDQYSINTCTIKLRRWIEGLLHNLIVGAFDHI